MSTTNGNSAAPPEKDSFAPGAASPAARSATPNPIRIVIADDHTIFRDCLRVFLHTEEGFEVIGEAADGEIATAVTRLLKPDILLLDMAMPRKDGMGVLKDLAHAGLPVRVLVLTAGIGRAETVQALQLGARGVILKSFPSATLFEGIKRVMAGDYWIGQESVASLIDAVGDPMRNANTPTSFGLTPREREVIVAVVSGYSNAEIAEKFSLSEQTVKHHLTHIFDKLGVYSRLELALFAVNHRLAGRDD